MFWVGASIVIIAILNYNDKQIEEYLTKAKDEEKAQLPETVQEAKE